MNKRVIAMGIVAFGALLLFMRWRASQQATGEAAAPAGEGAADGAGSSAAGLFGSLFSSPSEVITPAPAAPAPPAAAAPAPAQNTVADAVVDAVLNRGFNPSDGA